MGKQPTQEDPLSSDVIPAQDEPDYFATDDAGNLEDEDIDPAMQEILEEDAGSESPLEFEWVKRKFTPEEDDILIEFVKRNPFFYNMKMTSFINNADKQKKLRELAKQLKIPGELKLNLIITYSHLHSKSGLYHKSWSWPTIFG